MEIMKLVAAGKLNLEECFVDLPPDLSIDDKRCEGVKLYNMFIHTSGYGWFMRDKMADMFNEQNRKDFLIVLVIFVLAIAVIYESQKLPSTSSVDVGGLQASQLSGTEVSIRIPEDFFEDVAYIIIRNKKGDAEAYVPESHSNKFIVTLEEIKLEKEDRLTVTMYNQEDEALGEYKEVI